ncbi:MAG: hypothetical protein M3445_01855 [Actinomycetota bacterium]|nr:hypothetical protein [Actinomycetota bacterium]
MVKPSGVTFRAAFFKPANTLDVVLVVNGIPVATAGGLDKLDQRGWRLDQRGWRLEQAA